MADKGKLVVVTKSEFCDGNCRYFQSVVCLGNTSNFNKQCRGLLTLLYNTDCTDAIIIMDFDHSFEASTLVPSSAACGARNRSVLSK